jgi:hypothetical protein
MEGRVSWRGDVDDLLARIEQWRETGATHLSVNTMNSGLGRVDDHLAALESVASALRLGRS